MVTKLFNYLQTRYILKLRKEKGGGLMSIKERISYYELNISHLAEECGCSRRMFYSYLDYYDQKQLDRIPKKALRVLSIIANNMVASENNLNAFLNGANTIDEPGEENPYVFEEKIYLKSKNVQELVTQLKKESVIDFYRKRDKSYRFTVHKNGVFVYFVLNDVNVCDKFPLTESKMVNSISDIKKIFDETATNLLKKKDKIVYGRNDHMSNWLMSKSKKGNIVYRGNTMIVFKKKGAEDNYTMGMVVDKSYKQIDELKDKLYQLDNDTLVLTFLSGDESLIDRAKKIDKGIILRKGEYYYVGD